MGKMEGFQFSVGSLVGTVAWVEFATLNEGGESMTDFMTTLLGLFNLFFYSLCSLVLFDIFVRPRLCPSSSAATTTTPDDNNNDTTSLSLSTTSTAITSASVSNSNNGNGDSAFNMQQVTSSTFSGA